MFSIISLLVLLTRAQETTSDSPRYYSLHIAQACFAAFAGVRMTWDSEDPGSSISVAVHNQDSFPMRV